jgi:signal transduction histidine kinase
MFLGRSASRPPDLVLASCQGVLAGALMTVAVLALRFAPEPADSLIAGLAAALDALPVGTAVLLRVHDRRGALIGLRCELANATVRDAIGLRPRALLAGPAAGRSRFALGPPVPDAWRRAIDTGEPARERRIVHGRELEIEAIPTGDRLSVAIHDIGAAASLARSNRLLAEYAHVVAHELSEPLATASLYAEAAAAGPRGQTTDRLLAQVPQVLRGMQERLGTVLRVSERRASAPVVRSVDTAALVRDVVERLDPLVMATGARVMVAPLPRLRADPDGLALVVENLLVNAMRHRRDGATPRIRIGAARHGDAWELHVADDGPGIAPDEAERVFELFGRATAGTAPGTGIGLALCRAVVEQHGGRIWVDSRPGAGSTFRFTLPRRAAPPVRSAPGHVSGS